jgi:hypothetical protein
MIQRLRDDQRGAITLVGMAMAFVLTVACFHIFRTGYDVFNKIWGQTQADASVLEGAAWHATGMNLLVTLNIAMAFVLIPFLVVRLGSLMVIVGMAVVLAFSWVPGVAAGLGPLTRALDTLHRKEDALAGPTMKTLNAISRSERVVAASLPWIAASLPINRATGNRTGFMLGVSLLPDLDQWFKEVGFQVNPARRLIGGMNIRTQFPARMGSLAQPSAQTAATLRQKILAKLPTKAEGWLDFLTGSLPAQEEDYFQVCSRAAEELASLVTGVLVHTTGLSQGSADHISSTFGKVIGTVQTVTCAPLEEFKNTLAKQVNAQVDVSCKQQKTQYLSGGRHAAKARKWTIGMQQECEKKQRAQAEKAAGEGVKTRPTVETIKTAAVWGEMLRPQVNPLLHVWMSYYREDPERIAYSAEAEFFAPCDKYDRTTDSGGDKDDDGRSCGDNAMWRYGWDTIMVTKRSFTEEMVAHFGDFMRGWANRFVAKGIQGVIGRVAVAIIPRGKTFTPPGGPMPWIGGRHQQQPEPLEVLLSRHILGTRTTEAGNGFWTRRWAGSEVVRGILHISPWHPEFRKSLGDITDRPWH